MTRSSFGGPGLSPGQLTRLTNVGGLPLYVRSEGAPVFQDLINRLHDCRSTPLLSSGGYNKRKIAGTNTWSNHSWGLAVDLNAGTNPYSYTFRTDFDAAKVRALLKRYNGLIRWGGDYSGKKDTMHFEWIGTLNQLVAMATSIRVGASGLFSLGASGAKVSTIQMRLELTGFSTGAIDGDFGEKTLESVKAFQQLKGLGVDGIVGPDTLKALDYAPLSLKKNGKDFGPAVVAPATLLGDDRVRYSTTQLVMQSDGNVVHYFAGRTGWSSGIRGTELRVQSDGNLVLYLVVAGLSAAVWSSGTAKYGPGATLNAQADGNVVLRSVSGQPIWNAWNK